MPQILEKGKGALGHKIGPLPVWGWVGGGAVAVFVFSRFKGGGSGGSGAIGSVPIASLSSGATGTAMPTSDSFPIVNPAQNVRSGADTTIGGSPMFAVPTLGTQTGGGSGPSSNGSAGDAAAVAPVVRASAPTPSAIRRILAPTVTPAPTSQFDQVQQPAAQVQQSDTASALTVPAGPAYQIAQAQERPGGLGLIPTNATIVNVAGGGPPSGQGTSVFKDLINVPISLSNWAVKVLGIQGSPASAPASVASADDATFNAWIRAHGGE